jgi:hypothetical protein
MNCKIIDYSENSICVLGDTYSIRGRLIEIGGRYNKYLNVGGEKVAGWIFPKTKREIVEDVLDNTIYELVIKLRDEMMKIESMVRYKNMIIGDKDDVDGIVGTDEIKFEANIKDKKLIMY